jgi:single-strand DNA-binding protein
MQPLPWEQRASRPSGSASRDNGAEEKETKIVMYANRVSLIGFLGKNAETKTTRNNASFTVLSLATKRSWKDRETGERQSQTTWHRIIDWGKLGEYAAGLSKGAHLQIEGEIRTRDYVQKTGDKKSAEVKKTITEVRATLITKLDRPEKDANGALDAEGGAA